MKILYYLLGVLTLRYCENVPPGCSEWLQNKLWPSLTKWCDDGIGEQPSVVSSLRLVSLEKYEETYQILKDKYYKT